MHILFFSIIFVLTFMLPWWLVVPLWIGYVLMYDGYELVLLGVCMDAYMGTEGMWSVFYTCAAAIVVVSGLLLKPRLALYRDR